MMLAMKHGMGPNTAEEMYELNWICETKADHEPEEHKTAIFLVDAPAETIEKAVEANIKCMDKMEARWADGRAHACGANLSAADFFFLAGYT